ncbi:MAG: thiamine pyrophosphate-binding protein [candidate division NC10 bacterium]|nr:thiamine pyrophosphate-binding protein [candidate division NC10 bacterium]
MSGARAVVECLKAEGVEFVFGVPGGQTLSIMDVLYETPEIRFITTRDERGAAHMADAFGRITGTPGICLATTGPGATNLITGIGGAMRDSSPVIAITVNNRRKRPGRRSRGAVPEPHQVERPGHRPRAHPPRHARGLPAGPHGMPRAGPGGFQPGCGGGGGAGVHAGRPADVPGRRPGAAGPGGCGAGGPRAARGAATRPLGGQRGPHLRGLGRGLQRGPHLRGLGRGLGAGRSAADPRDHHLQRDRRRAHRAPSGLRAAQPVRDAAGQGDPGGGGPPDRRGEQPQRALDLALDLEAPGADHPGGHRAQHGGAALSLRGDRGGRRPGGPPRPGVGHEGRAHPGGAGGVGGRPPAAANGLAGGGDPGPFRREDPHQAAVPGPTGTGHAARIRHHRGGRGESGDLVPPHGCLRAPDLPQAGRLRQHGHRGPGGHRGQAGPAGPACRDDRGRWRPGDVRGGAGDGGAGTNAPGRGGDEQPVLREHQAGARGQVRATVHRRGLRGRPLRPGGAGVRRPGRAGGAARGPGRRPPAGLRRRGGGGPGRPY